MYRLRVCRVGGGGGGGGVEEGHKGGERKEGHRGRGRGKEEGQVRSIKSAISSKRINSMAAACNSRVLQYRQAQVKHVQLP